MPRGTNQISAKLPDMIRLQVDAGPHSLDILAKVAVTPSVYRAPEPDRDVF